LSIISRPISSDSGGYLVGNVRFLKEVNGYPAVKEGESNGGED